MKRRHELPVGIGGYESEWERAGKVVEEISGGPWDPDGTLGWYQLYHAVLDGAVRARLNGKVLEDLDFIRQHRWSDVEPYTLPANLEVSLVDARRIWNWDAHKTADLIALDLLKPGRATIKFETALENLRVLYRRLSVRVEVTELSEALQELEFAQRHQALLQECQLLASVPGQKADRLAELCAELETVEFFINHLLHAAGVLTKAPGGRKRSFDWDDAEQAVRAAFEHHGPLSSDDPEWSCQADVERFIQEHFLKTVGKEPATSGVRPHARKFIQAYGRQK